MKKIFIIDDEKDLAEAITFLLASNGYVCQTAYTLAEARKNFKIFNPDAIILDLKLPDGNGLEFLKTVREISPETGILIVSAYADLKTAVNAVKMGAFDIISKPFENEIILNAVRNVLNSKNIKNELRAIKKSIAEGFILPDIICRDQKTIEVMELIKEVADTNMNVILEGESGTGKELFARAIHYYSRRRDFRFVAVDCGAIPETVAESEIFGHEKGAFTDAYEQKQGYIEMSDRGTLFLDEISNLSAAVQAKLLRFIQERLFRRLGAKSEIRVDVRLLVATNLNLFTLVSEGKFREDLFYRLNQYCIKIPPLRERKNDIEVLLDYFVKSASLELSKKIRNYSPEVLTYLKDYDWPGNIRELKNLVFRLVLCSTEGTIDLKVLSRAMKMSSNNIRKVQKKEKIRLRKSFSKEEILRALKANNDNKKKTAEGLGIDRKTLYCFIKKYNI